MLDVQGMYIQRDIKGNEIGRVHAGCYIDWVCVRQAGFMLNRKSEC